MTNPLHDAKTRQGPANCRKDKEKTERIAQGKVYMLNRFALSHLGILSAMMIGVFATEALAKGDLSRRCKELPALTFGTDDTGYEVSQKKYELETGICYKMEIISTGRKEYALKGAKFFRNMWLRKVEVGEVEIKAFALDELEFEREGELEIFFTMIVPGKYELRAAGLEERGTIVTFQVNR